MTSFLRQDRSTPVAVWLWATAFLVFCMVVVGGATRLTGSGLSITEWKPVTGAIPPLNHDAWMRAFAEYQQIPQYRQINPDISLSGFQTLYWWEWSHRLLGRVVGVVFGLPFMVFLIRREIPRRLVWRCVGLFALGGLQGLVGWWMVASGLETRIYVAPERLAAHLGLALILFVALLWTGLDAFAGAPRVETVTPWRGRGWAFLVAVFFQCLLGALVAGSKAGLIYNDWPLFAGRLLPDAYWNGGLWSTIAHSQGAVQLHHRLFAYGLLIAGVVLGGAAWRDRTLPAGPKSMAALVLLVLFVQAGLGIATLMTRAPMSLSMIHQAGAATLLAVAAGFAWRVRRP